MSDKNNIDIAISSEKSLHEFIEDIVTINPCKCLVILTYSISDQSLRVIDDLKSEGKIEKLIFIFDKSLVSNKYKLLLYAENIADEIYINENHAKIVMFDDSVLLSSSNFNKIKRIEFFCHLQCKSTMNYLNNEMELIMKQSERIK
ncbi:MAG: hypothetical protein WCK02_16135 [Bacteroidota bacterium]